MCELGKWKNPTAFTAHYLRIGAAKHAASSFQFLEESAQVSPVNCAETDWSSTPGTDREQGGMDQEVQAQRTGEILPLVAGLVVE